MPASPLLFLQSATVTRQARFVDLVSFEVSQVLLSKVDPIRNLIGLPSKTSAVLFIGCWCSEYRFD